MSKSDSIYNIKYLAVYSYNSKAILSSWINSNYESEKDKITSSAENLIDKLLMMDLGNGEMHTENLRSEKICCEIDMKSQFCYLAMIQYTYPERLIYSLLNEVKDKYNKDLNMNLIDNYSQATKQIKDKIQLTFVELERKYRDPANVSVIHRVDNEIRDVNKIMKENIRNVVTNEDTLLQLNAQAQKINETSDDYMKNAKGIKKYFKWQNKKLLVIGGVSAVTLGGILLFKFI